MFEGMLFFDICGLICYLVLMTRVMKVNIEKAGGLFWAGAVVALLVGPLSLLLCGGAVLVAAILKS